MHSSCLSTGPVKLTWVGTAVVEFLLLPLLVANAAQVLYRIGERGTRGSEVMLVPNLASTSAALCSVTCAAASACLGFNWMPKAAQKCELLSSLRLVTSDASCDLYVPDILKLTAIKLEYSCPTCMPQTAPSAIVQWAHRCNTNDVTVGIASHTAFPDLDYMLCIQVPGMLMTLTNGYAAKNNARSCNTLGNINNTVIDSLWGNEQYYNPATSLGYPCRIILSNQKVDLTRCLKATETYGYVSDVRRPVKMLLCPPHMVAQALYATPTVRAFVTCCLMY